MKSQFISPKEESNSQAKITTAITSGIAQGQGDQQPRQCLALEAVVDQQRRAEAEQETEEGDDGDELECHPAGVPEILGGEEPLVIGGGERPARLVEPGDVDVLEGEIDRDEQRIDDDQRDQQHRRRQQQIAEPVPPARAGEVEEG
jgi:hypothetical protein